MWVEETKNGKFKACERYTDPVTGRQKKVSVTLDKDNRQTRKKASEILKKRIEEEQAAALEPERITFGVLVEAYRADQKLTVRKSTYQRNYHAMNTLMDILGKDTLMTAISASFIRQRLLRTGKEPGTLNEHLARLRALYAWAYKNDLVADQTIRSKLTPFKAPPHREVIKDKYMESQELNLLLSEMSQEVWRDFTEFLALSGLRIGEAIALEAKDIDLRSRQIHVTKAYDSVNKVVTTAKSLCSVRDVYIQPELEKSIRKLTNLMNRRILKNGLSRPALFLFDNRGGHIRYYTYNKYLRENTERVLGRKLTPHALRHTHASLLLENGVPIDVISRRLGHENSRVTKEIYLHVTRKLKEKDDALFDRISLL